MASLDTYPRQNARTRRYSLGAPRDFAVAEDGSTVLYLRSPAGDDPVNSLWRLDVATGAETEMADPRNLEGDGVLPAAEKARRERAREAGGGIVSFDATDGADVVVFALAGRVYRIDGSSLTELTSSGDAFDPRVSPDGRHVAYVAGATLRITGEDGDRQLKAEADETVSWGSAEFIAAEEMGRSRGYWWSPDSDAILAQRVDVAPVETWWISGPVEPDAAPVPIRYPAAGTANAGVALAFLGLDGAEVPVDWPVEGFEYLADVRWTTDGLILTGQTRDQRIVAVFDVNPATGEVAERYRWSDHAWVELVSGVPRLAGERLVTAQDRDGFRRLVVDDTAISPVGVDIRRVIDVDDSGILVAATAEATEVHLATVGFDGMFDWVTYEPGVHSGVRGGSTTVVQSTTMAGSQTVVLNSGAPHRVASHVEEAVVDPNPMFLELGPHRLRAALLLPADADPGQPLPVLLDPYGGPHALRVMKARSMFYASQWFADQGFAVLVVDGRGTPARGSVWEREVRGDLAQPVLDDQVDALLAAAEIDTRLDLNRVAIRGWSFGGYLAALAVLREPEIFHAAVAGAPVTDWRLYDTHYTERYLGHPESEPENYERCDLTAEAAKLVRPLLLIHGLADDNVVAAHTLQLSRALLEAGRPHSVLPLSGVTHMTPQEEVAENLLLVQLAFLRDALG